MKPVCIGVGRFRILGGPRFRILGGGGGGARGGPNSQQAHDDVLTSFRRHVPTRFFINQWQIIIFLILKSDNTENSRFSIERNGFASTFKSN